MTIIEAARSTSEKEPYITRRAWQHLFAQGEKRIKVLLTDTPDLCCIYSPRNSRGPCRGWQPSGEDLVADDWEVCS